MFEKPFSRRHFLSATGTTVGAVAAAQASLSLAGDEKKPAAAKKNCLAPMNR
jgi:hypothetical protein